MSPLRALPLAELPAPRKSLAAAAYQRYKSLAYRVRAKLFKLKLRHLQGIQIGKGTTISPSAVFMDYGLVTIGANCSISGVLFITHSGSERIYKLRPTQRPIVVGDNCMIGANVSIMPGVRIGSNSVIGAHCYVSKNVPPNTVMKPPEAVAAGTTFDYIARNRPR